MNNLSVRNVGFRLKEILRNFSERRDLSEVRDVFLVLYTLRYLSTGYHHLVVRDVSTVSGLLSQDQKDLDARLQLSMEMIAGDNPRVFDQWNHSVDFQSRAWGVGEKWRDKLSEALEALRDLDFESLCKDNNKIFYDLFRSLLDYFAEQSGKRAGEFYSPPEVGKLIVDIMAPSENCSIYDPVCGSGGFLSLATEYIEQKNNGRKVSRLVGQERNVNTWLVAKLNMIIHGYEWAEITNGDTLLDPGNLKESGEFEKFDVVVANPPFSQKYWGREFLETDKRFGFGIPPKSNADYAYILHVIESMAINGRAGMVVSSGALFRGGVEKSIRQKIVESGVVDAVVSLPPNLFYGTGIQANILFLRKQKIGEEVLFLNASDSYEKSESKNNLPISQIESVVELYKRREDVEGKSRCVSISEISNNDFNLSVSRYVSKSIKEDVEPLENLLKRQNKLEAELSELQGEMKGIVDSIL